MTYVNITFEPDEEEPKHWALTFTFKAGDLDYEFVVEEPYMNPKEDWLALADGKTNLYLYCGNGDGSIYQRGDNLMFVAAPSGGGGDVTASLAIARCLVADKLKAVIEEVLKQGFEFSS